MADIAEGILSAIDNARTALGIEAGWIVSVQRHRSEDDALALLEAVGPWADRMLGYHVATGITEEWIWWGASSGNFADYSPAMQRGFREFLTASFKRSNRRRASCTTAKQS